jgi:hypothetical protein
VTKVKKKIKGKMITFITNDAGTIEHSKAKTKTKNFDLNLKACTKINSAEVELKGPRAQSQASPQNK